LVVTIEIAFPKVKRNLIERALFPLFRLRQPKRPALGVQRSTFAAYRFLTAYFRKSVHEPHSCGVRSTDADESLAERQPACLTLVCKTVLHDAAAKCVNCDAAFIRLDVFRCRTVQLWDGETPGSGAARHIPLLVIG
jgi:hypothetical protein